MTNSHPKKLAEESLKTKKAREKLKKKLEEADQKVTQQALEKKTIEIHRWIALHAPQRIVLKAKNISLFDENQNAAELSSRVAALANQLHSSIFQNQPIALDSQEDNTIYGK